MITRMRTAIATYWETKATKTNAERADIWAGIREEQAAGLRPSLNGVFDLRTLRTRRDRYQSRAEWWRP